MLSGPRAHDLKSTLEMTSRIESGIMNRSGRGGDITKPVENTVPDGLFPRDEQNVSRENSTMSFEHV